MSLTQAQIVESISEHVTGTISKADIRTVLRVARELAEGELYEGEDATILGLVKIKVVYAPPKPKRKGINPFTQEEQVFAAKPASLRLKAFPSAAAKAALPAPNVKDGKALVAKLAQAIEDKAEAAAKRKRAAERAAAKTAPDKKAGRK